MTRTQRLSLLAAIMGTFVVGLDSTVVNVALPAIEKDLGGGLAGQQWVSNGYLLALAALILVGGSLGDLLGERRVFTVGVVGFGAMSLVCALAPRIEVVVAGRVAQGVFGALLTPSALAVIVAAFPPAQRGGAVGSWTAWSGIATVVGPLVGGQLIDGASWRWIFAINIPFVIATLVLISIAVPERERASERPHIDWPGAALSFLGLAGPTLALIREPASGWGAPDVLVPGLAGIAFLGLFLAREATTAHPMLELALFRRRNFAAGNLQTLAMYAGLSILFFYLVLFLQQVAGYDALQAGFATLPTTIVMFALSKRAGMLADRIGPRYFMGAGPLVAACGLVLLLRVGADVDYWTELFPALLVFSIGLSATVAPLTATVLSDADEQHAGIASGINNAIARAAGLLGVAALGAVIASQFAGALHERIDVASLSPAGRAVVRSAEDRVLARADVSGLAAGEAARVRHATEAASVAAFHTGMGISAALVGLGGILGLAFVRNPRRAVACADCAGGQLAGAPLTAAREPAIATAVP
ncbi:MAG TPA: DHA2 family efflux MFS transporter permease subunit [Solirubrobacteraceae bacterium]|jgi:EmrB/QacA subfamily drug resistance transporter|nr:DHA2 family efflux MFS transporter permease subunit [Solirubrobacteraceae bacterium]